jgi:hypothetical protein
LTKIKLYPAKNGDAMLIYDASEQPFAILIDGGYASTFQQYIAQDLKKISQQGYSLDLVVATHIDADHICGLLSFIEENGNSESPKIIEVREVWHNSLRSIPTSTTPHENSLDSADKDLIDEISRQGFPIAEESVIDPVEISARQGSSFAALLLGGGYRWNSGDGTQSINSDETSLLELQPDVQIRVLGPSMDRLKQLRRWWIRKLQRLGYAGSIGENYFFDDAFEFLCAAENVHPDVVVEPTLLSASTIRSLDETYLADDSVTNGSSISIIIEIGSLCLLLLGDSWAEDIEVKLQALPNAAFPMIFDAIKISHHGSLHNTSPALLELVDSPIFLISSNGDMHDHPDIEVLKAIVDRPAGFKRHLYFNYTTTASQNMHNYTSKSGADFEIYDASAAGVEIELEQL